MNEPSMELLLAALNRTDSDIKDLRREIQELRAELKSDISKLNAFRWQIYGIASFISLGLTIIINKFV